MFPKHIQDQVDELIPEVTMDEVMTTPGHEARNDGFNGLAWLVGREVARIHLGVHLEVQESRRQKQIDVGSYEI